MTIPTGLVLQCLLADPAREEEMKMVTWVLAEEPTFEVAQAIEIVEARLGSTEEVMWLCPEALDIAEPVQD